MNFVLFFIISILLVQKSYCLKIVSNANNFEEEWENFKVTYQKSYANEKDEKIHKNTFISNLSMILKHNQDFEKGLTPFKMDINEFTDRTDKEINLDLNINGSGENVQRSDFDVNQLWENFKKIYNKTYNNEEDEIRHRKVFELNLDIILKNNNQYVKGLSSFKMSINQFTDRSIKEMVNASLPRKLKKRDTTQFDVETEWTKFKATYSKTYTNTQDEEQHKKTFELNLAKISKHNENFDKGLTSYRMGINQFSDQSEKDIVSKLKLNGSVPWSNSGKTVGPDLKETVPDSFDWRTKKVVTEVKNQGNCGSCWAFSAIGTVESQYALNMSELKTFSEQSLVDCDTTLNNGCNGGNIGIALHYIQSYGVPSESSYSYEAKQSNCRKYTSAVKIERYTSFPPSTEGYLKTLVYTIGPIAVAIDATHLSDYSSGVFDYPSCLQTNPNHGVLVVGYGTENNKDYWIVKNSWGSRWGENGFFRMSRNKNNQCGIANYIYYTEGIIKLNSSNMLKVMNLKIVIGIILFISFL